MRSPCCVCSLGIEEFLAASFYVRSASHKTSMGQCILQFSLGLEPSARGYNWATVFLGDINTGTWPSRLGKSQMSQ
jgi:hypothetical protein